MDFNMKTLKITIIWVVAALLTLSSCRVTEVVDPDIDIPGLGGYEYPENDLDRWLTEVFREPYNIEIVYRWDAVKVYNGVTKRLVPVEYDKVKPMMTAISKIWFEPYLFVADYGFLQKYAPKTVVLAGSPEYAGDGGSMVLGTAEGAVKIFLTNANAFNPSNRTTLRNYMHVIEHEFVHVLNQSVNFNEKFTEITPQYYDPTGWTSHKTEEEAYRRGFFSRYSMVSPDEDFAEVMSLMLVNGVDWFEETVLPVADTSTVNPFAAKNLRDKVAAVETYLGEEFNIQFFDNAVTGEKGFITVVQEAMDYVINNSN